MSFLIRRIIRAFASHSCRLSCSSGIWRRGLLELRRRGMGRHESGAFLLGFAQGEYRLIREFAYYDDLDPSSLASGSVALSGASYGRLWDACRKKGLIVVADIHTHPGLPHQSEADRDNPMIATPGHISLIVPRYAERLYKPKELGIYEYLGGHRWRNRSGMHARGFFRIGFGGSL